MSDILARLSAPFQPSVVGWRVTNTSRDKKKGMVACYIDARDVANRLDEVLGCDWQDEIIVQPGLVTCRIGILIDGAWRWRQDGAATVLSRGDDEKNVKDDQQRGMHSKGAMSDAFKRCAVKWGIGRYLYGLDSPWVEIDEWKGIQKKELPRLNGIIERHYAEWAKAQRQPLASVPTKPQSQPPRQADPDEDDAPEPGTNEPDEYIDADGVVHDTEAILAEARKNADFHRIEQLLTRNVRVLGDVTRIVRAENNLAAINTWPEPWKDVMRNIVHEAKRRANENRPAEEQAAA